MVIFMNIQERMNESIRETYRKIAYCLIEKAPEGWREWPLDPDDPSKGVLQAQKRSSQKGVKRGDKFSAGTRRTRVVAPADDLGIQGTRTTHTTTKGGSDTWSPEPIQQKSGPPIINYRRQAGRLSKGGESTTRTSVKGKTPEGKQINVKQFPYSPRKRT